MYRCLLGTIFFIMVAGYYCALAITIVGVLKLHVSILN